MTRIESDVRRWLGDGKTFTGAGETGLVRAILGSFMAVYLEHEEQTEILEVLAKVTGHDGVLRMLGASICGGDGSRTLKLEPMP